MSFQILPDTSSSGGWQDAKKSCLWLEFKANAPNKARFWCSRLCFQILPDTSGFGNSDRSYFSLSLPIVGDRYTLENLGKDPGLVGIIFLKAQNKISNRLRQSTLSAAFSGTL